MSEHVITMLTIYEKVTDHGKAGKSTKKVSVVLERTGDNKGKQVENIQCSAWSQGPRGGYNNAGALGFTLEEFDRIYSHINVLNYGLKTALYETVANIEKPWDSVLRCNRCDTTFDTRKLMEHRESIMHKGGHGTLSS